MTVCPSCVLHSSYRVFYSSTCTLQFERAHHEVLEITRESHSATCNCQIGIHKPSYSHRSSVLYGNRRPQYVLVQETPSGVSNQKSQLIELPTTQNYRPEEEKKTITAADFEPSTLNSSPPYQKKAALIFYRSLEKIDFNSAQFHTATG